VLCLWVNVRFIVPDSRQSHVGAREYWSLEKRGLTTNPVVVFGTLIVLLLFVLFVLLFHRVFVSSLVCQIIIHRSRDLLIDLQLTWHRQNADRLLWFVIISLRRIRLQYRPEE